MAKFNSGLFHGTSGSPQLRLDLEHLGSTQHPDTGATSSMGNRLPTGESQLRHLFRNAPGHLPYSEENVRRIERLIGDERNYVGTDAQHGNRWYSKTLPDGSQLWAKVHNGIVSNCGLNETPRSWSPQTGFDSITPFINPKRGGK